MAVLSGATASGRQFATGYVGTTSSTIYTAPAASVNVTSPSATAYVKEIILCNVTASAAIITISVNSTPIINALSIPANDTKILSGLNTMIPAGGTITAVQGTTNAISLIISGVEVQ